LYLKGIPRPTPIMMLVSVSAPRPNISLITSCSLHPVCCLKVEAYRAFSKETPVQQACTLFPSFLIFLLPAPYCTLFQILILKMTKNLSYTMFDLI
jgi:hypothetical protein